MIHVHLHATTKKVFMPALLLPAEAGRLLLASRAALEPSVRSTEVAGLEHLRRRGGGPEARVVFCALNPNLGGGPEACPNSADASNQKRV